MRIVSNAVLVALGFAAACLSTADAQTLTTIHAFCKKGHCERGQLPRGKLLLDASGNLYGTTGFGGDKDGGTIFRMVKDGGGQWSFQSLHSFCSKKNCERGAHPASGVIADIDGNLYGTTAEGGRHQDGHAGVVYVWRPSPAGEERKFEVLYQFCSTGGDSCLDGYFPVGGLTYAGEASGVPYDGVSPLYGVASRGGGGNSRGVAFSLAPDGGGHWTETVLHVFTGTGGDGIDAVSGLTMDGSGNLYGTTLNGGAFGRGTVYKLAPAGGGAWNETILYSFCAQQLCQDGYAVDNGVLIDGAGNLYGSAGAGGTHDAGTVYKLTPSGGDWTFGVLYDFCSLELCADGKGDSFLTLDPSGDLIGTVMEGGAHRRFGGALFRLHGSEETVLYDFGVLHRKKDGLIPWAPVVLDSDGHMLGTTYCGGTKGTFDCKVGAGTVFEVTP